MKLLTLVKDNGLTFRSNQIELKVGFESTLRGRRLSLKVIIMVGGKLIGLTVAVYRLDIF